MQIATQFGESVRDGRVQERLKEPYNVVRNRQSEQKSALTHFRRRVIVVRWSVVGGFVGEQDTSRYRWSWERSAA